MWTSPQRWRRLRYLLLLCLIGMIGGACADQTVAPAPTAKRTPTLVEAAQPPRPTQSAVAADQQTWLVMLYDDADDEILEEDMYNDLNEAELVGSSDRVHIVAQMDRYDGGFDGDGDWTTAKRFLVQQDDDLSRPGSVSVQPDAGIDLRGGRRRGGQISMGNVGRPGLLEDRAITGRAGQRGHEEGSPHDGESTDGCCHGAPSVARLTRRAPWLCVPGSPRVCRFESGRSASQNPVSHLTISRHIELRHAHTFP